MNSIDPVQLQRLVDGELEYSEMQMLLASLDHQDVDNWKSIATSFIENQIFRSQFETIEPSVVAETVLHENSETNSNSYAQPSSSFAQPNRWILSLAASVLLMLAIGTLIGTSYFGSRNKSGGVPISTDGNMIAGQGSKNRKSNNPAVYRMQVEDEKGNQFIDTDVPFYPVADWKDVDRHRFKEYPENIRNRVLNSGYDFQQDTRLLRGRLKDGRSFVVPIRNTKFAPFQ